MRSGRGARTLLLWTTLLFVLAATAACENTRNEAGGEIEELGNEIEDALD